MVNQTFPTPRAFYFLPAVRPLSQTASISIRVTVLNGEAWFAAPDLAFALEFSLRERRFCDQYPSLHTALISYLDDDEYLSDQHETWIRESGVLHVLRTLSTREAEAFRRWIIAHVLPEARLNWAHDLCMLQNDNIQNVIPEKFPPKSPVTPILAFSKSLFLLIILNGNGAY